MNFKVATLKDIPVLCKLLTELFSLEKEFTPNEELQKEALKTIIEDEKIGHILVCELDGRIVAMVNILYSISTALGSRVALLEDMIVSSEYRNQNIGSALLEFAKDFAKTQGCKRITLLTDNDNFNAHKFYEKNDFQKSSMIPFRSLI